MIQTCSVTGFLRKKKGGVQVHPGQRRSRHREISGKKVPRNLGSATRCMHVVGLPYTTRTLFTWPDSSVRIGTLGSHIQTPSTINLYSYSPGGIITVTFFSSPVGTRLIICFHPQKLPDTPTFHFNHNEETPSKFLNRPKEQGE